MGDIRKVTIGEFLTEEQIKQAVAIFAANPSTPARELCDRLIRPNLKEINRKLGQENDPMYLAYAVEYVIRESGAAETSH